MKPALAAVPASPVKTVQVSVFPTVQHRHTNGDIVSVKLRRNGGDFAVVCDGCGTRFVYAKPLPSHERHYPSPLLPEIKGNYDPGESH